MREGSIRENGGNWGGGGGGGGGSIGGPRAGLHDNSPRPTLRHHGCICCGPRPTLRHHGCICCGANWRPWHFQLKLSLFPQKVGVHRRSCHPICRDVSAVHPGLSCTRLADFLPPWQ